MYLSSFFSVRSVRVNVDMAQFRCMLGATSPLFNMMHATSLPGPHRAAQSLTRSQTGQSVEIRNQTL